MIRIISIIGVAILCPSLALAQQEQPLTPMEQRLAICTVTEARMAQQMAEMQARIATLEKVAKATQTPPEVPKP
jgi:hypothetical protein